jgi:hypothetical protein
MKEYITSYRALGIYRGLNIDKGNNIYENFLNPKIATHGDKHCCHL